MIMTTASLLEVTHAQIEKDLDTRTADHQATIKAKPLGLVSGPEKLNLIAVGDSWFDYPLDGNLYGIHTDVPSVLAQKTHMLNLAHYGYTSSQEMGYLKQQRFRVALTTPANGKFDAILMSCGGNDIAGDALCIWLNDAWMMGKDKTKAVNQQRFSGVLAMVQASILDMIALRNEYLPSAPILIHSYDYVIVTGKGVCNIGPWLQPSLAYCGWTDPIEGAWIVNWMLDQYSMMLNGMAAVASNYLIHVKTQGTLNASQWANELHPTPEGFKLVAAKFINELAVAFPGRVT